MPKIGRYVYPVFDVDFALEKLREFRDTLKEDESTRTVLAETLGMSEKGGGFAHLVAAMEKYGLIRTGGGKIIVTDLGKTCIYGEEQEKEAGRTKAVANVELFHDIYSLHGPDAKVEQIRAFLRQKASADLAEAQSTASKVYKTYKKVANYLRPDDAVDHNTIAHEQPPQSFSENVSGLTKSEALKIQYGDLYIQVPPDDEQAITLAIEALQFMRDRRKTEHLQANP